jgi:hypothetical protein
MEMVSKKKDFPKHVGKNKTRAAHRHVDFLSSLYAVEYADPRSDCLKMVFGV